MGNRSNVLDHLHFQTNGLQCTDRSFTAGSRTLYVYFYRLQTVFHCCLCCGFSSCLCSERSRLSGAAEAQSARACPRNGVALCVGDGYDGVVECGLNVYSTVFNVLTLSAAANNNLSAVPKRNTLPYFFLFAMVFTGPLRVLAFVLVRCPLTGRPLR